MKKGARLFLIGAASAAITTAAWMAGSCTAADAVPVLPAEEWIQREPETVMMWIVPAEAADPIVYVPAVRERILVPQEWTDADVELLARLLWSSPLRHEDMKRQIIWVVLNRVDDERMIFPATIAENVNRREFTFYDRKAYLSETNLRIAREELERWTRVLSGIEERPVPEGYVYLRFAGDNNRMIYLMKEPGGEAL